MTGVARLLLDVIKGIPGYIIDACNSFVRRVHRPEAVEGIDGGTDALVCPTCMAEWPCKPFLDTYEEQP